MLLPHSPDCRCKQCTDQDELQLVATLIKSPTATLIADSVEYRDGQWYVRFHTKYSDTVQNSFVATLARWNQLAKE